MELALEQARLAALAGEVPVGALVISNSEIVGVGHNRNLLDRDPTAHAEIVALRQATARLGNHRLSNARCTVYATIEPCSMCAGALIHARVSRLVYGAPDPKAGATGSVLQVLNHPSLNHKMEVTGGVLADQCSEILQDFFRRKREGMKLSEPSGTLADHPFSGRPPTSHERMTGLPWDASYQGDEPAPWDIGRPQPAIVRLASAGGFAGAVLDAGCGTGENALHLAWRGLSVLGVDVAETALAIARQKAADRGIEIEFAAADAFHLEQLGRRFQTVLDCGLFHTFAGFPGSAGVAVPGVDERAAYVASLASVTEHGGNLYILCFSDEGPETGPHPVSQQELRAAFNPGNGWNVIAIEPDRIQTRFNDHGAPAWFATIKRL
jgi:tRNA(Arg) A34 adenosine deaminase TadA/SAM-dependent methyltransferase